ncbi:MAG: glutamine-hydrolyzing GMP synthase [Bacteroidetes bacterium]|nr:glutamine-hydrolyzing GMP synthase [Bacteroidota bacterium]MBP8754689.1 glutamine-hydrolyzing GMP synthase [Chitinophagales bacterium]MBK8488288.1 glutamine-hydrolyzing GMP synthase [Bacteroidota bacterium]MBK8681950.1 glutamine-hydrolyzing GMP synthase [Bacteroidota bacterium]MBP9188797.1 glutamine-hydrolyzing GMP synthase [Chitinophagales bacterium]
MNEKILILDFGSQYTQLIARRIRELNVYCEIAPCTKIPEITKDIKGIILSGSPFSVSNKDLPAFDYNKVFNKKPILGVCYGAQFMAKHFNGDVQSSAKREYGRAFLHIMEKESSLFFNVNNEEQVWMSHSDTVTKVPDGFFITARTASIDIAAFQSKPDQFKFPMFGIQFHPEVTHSISGMQILENFVVTICGCDKSWTPESFVEETVKNLKTIIGNDKVVLGLSGGVDSSVAAILLHNAIGKNLTCIFVNNGLLRKNEFDEVLASYKDMGLNIVGIDSSNQFLTALENIIDPEKKRKAIGRVFIEVFQQEAKKIDGVQWLGQGTIYPDVIESISVHGPSATIKSHHNVGGLPDILHLKVIEPLRSLFKDEVRKVGTALNIKKEILNRHPFPGPGLAIRIIDDITPERVRMTQDADFIFIDHLKKSGWYDKVWQAGAILLPVKTVGVMGDERTYENVVALRCVNSSDGMTADWSHLPHELLSIISSDIINHVKGINRVVYDISSKPPATIEWE